MRVRASSPHLVAILLLTSLATARAQDGGADGLSQKVSPGTPRGAAVAGGDSTGTSSSPTASAPAPGPTAKAASHPASPSTALDTPLGETSSESALDRGKPIASLDLTQGTETCTGAYFCKVSSRASKSYVGITGTGTLPRASFDPARYHYPAASEAAWLEGPMDIPSVYMGGNAGTELDAGLSWERVYDKSGQPTWTDLPGGTDGGDPAHRFSKHDDTDQLVDGNDVSHDPAGIDLVANFGFRPFWRTIYQGQNTWGSPGSARRRIWFSTRENTSP